MTNKEQLREKWFDAHYEWVASRTDERDPEDFALEWWLDQMDQREEEQEISLCPDCHCMTKKVCGKCYGEKLVLKGERNRIIMQIEERVKKEIVEEIEKVKRGNVVTNYGTGFNNGLSKAQDIINSLNK